jgi:Xaa-Pro aminopeptidase
MWLPPSPAQCFVDRRRRLLARCDVPCVLGSGIARVRNFAGNRFAFRAESHFLYFVGRHLEEALLCFEQGEVSLYLPQPDPEAELWDGPKPSLETLSEQLQLPVHPLDEFEAPEQCATLLSADAETALWLEELLGREDSEQNERLDQALAEHVIALRLCHDSFALQQMRAAAAVTARAHLAGMAATRPERREAEVRAAIEAEMTAAGLMPAYNSIVTVHGEVLHHPHSANLMQTGDLLLVDAGAESPEGWASDVTRTWPVSGRFERLQAEVYSAVLQAQQAAIAHCHPGVSYRDVHRLAGRVLVEGLVQLGLFKGTVESLLERGAAAVFFPHGIGHLLGLDVHDMEDLGDLAGYAPGRQRSTEPQEKFLRLDRDLLPDMVVTIEPGFYRIDALLAGSAFEPLRADTNLQLLQQLRCVRGIRIEDDVRITADGPEVLTAAIPKTLTDLESCVGA